MVDDTDRWSKTRETLALILLSVTAVLTAWCGFEAAKWGGEMSIAFSRASTARLEAARHDVVANNMRQEDLTVYAFYTQAQAAGNEQFARYIQDRFSDPLRVAFDAWNAAGRSVRGPLAMAEYVPPGARESAAADQRADELFAQALVNNQRGDNYTVLTVLAALVLFFGAISGRLSRASLQWAALMMAFVLFLIGAGFAATFPVII